MSHMYIHFFHGLIPFVLDMGILEVNIGAWKYSLRETAKSYLKSQLLHVKHPRVNKHAISSVYKCAESQIRG